MVMGSVCQELSLAPATFVRSLARKLGADPDTDLPQRRVWYINLTHTFILNI